MKKLNEFLNESNGKYTYSVLFYTEGEEWKDKDGGNGHGRAMIDNIDFTVSKFSDLIKKVIQKAKQLKAGDVEINYDDIEIATMDAPKWELKKNDFKIPGKDTWWDSNPLKED